MRITFIANFGESGYDEKNIATSLERLGHTVQRIHERGIAEQIIEVIDTPDLVLWFKLNNPKADLIVNYCNERYTTACWIFDLYIGYPREYRLNQPCFKAKYLFTTDGGHQKEFEERGFNHKVVRQGIFKDDCYIETEEKEYDVIFVGSDNPYFPERRRIMQQLEKEFNFKWFGKKDTNEVRGKDLNKLFAKTKLVVGDSVPSPHYWSNRVVETLGRGGCLIHVETEGLREEYPDILTYDGTVENLCEIIRYYIDNESEREHIIRTNHHLVRNNYTMEDKCEELLNYVKI